MVESPVAASGACWRESARVGALHEGQPQPSRCCWSASCPRDPDRLRCAGVFAIARRAGDDQAHDRRRRLVFEQFIAC
ncbi:hypothetical protein ACPA9J_00120 [Pseudomonas aeruginosa]